MNVYEAVTSTGLPCAHLAYPEGSAPKLPWCVYYLDETPGFSADNTMFTTIRRWVIEHYWKTYDAQKDNALDEAILSNFGPFDKSETWVDEENCAMTVYYFNQIGD